MPPLFSERSSADRGRRRSTDGNMSRRRDPFHVHRSEKTEKDAATDNDSRITWSRESIQLSKNDLDHSLLQRELTRFDKF